MDKTLLERIDKAAVANRELKSEINDILYKAKDQLKSKGKADYERGMNDIWEAINCFRALTYEQRNTHFGLNAHCNGVTDIFNNFTSQDFLAKYEAYKKYEEQEKCTNFKRGDKVKCYGGKYCVFDAIYYGENKEDYWVLSKEDVAPQKLPKNDSWILVKTGTSVNIDSLF